MKKGFTLVELLLVIALFLIVGTTSSIFYSRFLIQNTVTTTSDQLKSTLRKAQWYAIMGKNGGVWGVHIDVNRIILFQGDSYENRTTAFDETLSVYAPVSISTTDVLFTKRTGTLENEVSIVISGGNESRTLFVNKQGIVN